MSSTTNVENSLSFIHAQEHITSTEIKELQARNNIEPEEDIFQKFFIDPFKYHQLADEMDA